MIIQISIFNLIVVKKTKICIFDFLFMSIKKTETHVRN